MSEPREFSEESDQNFPHLSVTVWRLCVFLGHAADDDFRRPNSLINLLKQLVSSTHLTDVHPTVGHEIGNALRDMSL